MVIALATLPLVQRLKEWSIIWLSHYLEEASASSKSLAWFIRRLPLYHTEEIWAKWWPADANVFA